MRAVLDFGAGDRRFARLCEAFMTGYTVIGIDKQPRERHYMLWHYEWKKEGQLIFQDGFFEKITCLSSLQYCEDLPGLFVEFYRVLKDKGELVITYPFFWHPYNLLHCDVVKGWKFVDKALRDAGFTLVEKGLFGGGSYVIVRGLKGGD